MNRIKKAIAITGISAYIIYFFATRGGMRMFKYMLLFRRKLYTDNIIRSAYRGFFHEGRYYWNLHLPGFPAQAFFYTVRQELNRLIDRGETSAQYYLLFIAITNKCALNCQHCFEWDALNNKEPMSTDEISSTLSKHQQKGLGQVFFTGGEPLNRFDTLLTLLPTVKTAETWIATSGWGLTREKAIMLKNHGLTGIMVSLDHYVQEQHNQFRGNDKSYSWALKAIENAQSTGLLTAFSLCPTNDFVENGNFNAYMEFCTQMNVKFVQIIEPKPEGRNADFSLCLTRANQKRLETSFLAYNPKKAYRSFPILIYTDYVKRIHGCEGMKDRHRYIDTMGNEHPCPFCKTSDPGFEGCKCSFANTKLQ